MSYDHLQQQTATTTTTATISTPQQYQYHHQQQQQQQQSSENSNNNNNTTYRPRSPDLSAYILPAQQPQLPQQRNLHQGQQQGQPSLFHPNYQDHPSTSNNQPSTTSSSSWQQQRQGSSTALTGLPITGGEEYPPPTHGSSYDASPYFSPQRSFSLGSGAGQSQGQVGYFVGGGQQQRRETLQGYGSVSAGAGTGAPVGEYSRLTHSPTAASAGGGGGERFCPGRGFGLQHQHRQQPPLQPHGQQGFVQTSTSNFTTDQPQGQPPANQLLSSSFSLNQQHPQQNMPPSRRKRGQTDDNGDSGDHEYTPESSTGGGAAVSAKSSRKRKSDSGQTWVRAPGEVGPSLGIDVKTKFPVARIKRIMQADEDVGKVAQATPTAVCESITFVDYSIMCLRMLTFLFSESTRVIHDHACEQGSS
jgi:hypothetical protein